MRYLHTMVRISDVEQSLRFYCEVLGLQQFRRHDSEQGRFSLIFLAAPEDLEACKRGQASALELTWNWDPEQYSGGRNFGHLAYEVDDIYAACAHAQSLGVVINRPPRDGRMAFLRSPDGVSVELLQKGEALAPAEPWASQANIGSW